MDILHEKLNPRTYKCKNIRWEYSDTKFNPEQSERKKQPEL